MLIHGRNRVGHDAQPALRALMAHRLKAAAIIRGPAREEPRGPDPRNARIIRRDPVLDVVVGRIAGVEEFDADEEATGGYAVDLVVDPLLRREGGEATGPVGRHGVGGEDAGG